MKKGEVWLLGYPCFLKMIQHDTLLASSSTTAVSSSSSSLSSISFTDYYSNYWKGFYGILIVCDLSCIRHDTVIDLSCRDGYVSRSSSSTCIAVNVNDNDDWAEEGGKEGRGKKREGGKRTTTLTAVVAVVDRIPMDDSDSDLISIWDTVTKLCCIGLLVLSRRKQFLSMLSLICYLKHHDYWYV